MDLFEAIRTTRSMRRLADTPVAEADIAALIDAAVRGPSGGNSQRARWLVVTDPELKRQVGEVYRRCAAEVLGGYADRGADAKMLSSSWHLADHMGEAPVLIVACCKGPAGRYASSVYPGAQNLMLAARGLGLGTTLTTIHLCDEAAIKRILAIPEDVATYCIIPVGYPLGRWGEAPRRPVEEQAFRDLWGNAFELTT